MQRKGEQSEERTALYRKYRPSTLAEIVGQPQVTEVLRRSLEQGKVSHAYLLTGPRGVGKTSIARILAHEINQLPYTDESTHLDIIEIDAASNNGVEDVRDLREKVQLAPIAASKKVYIIDEVHMLSKQAFNALLKTLEEPPAHVVFILATTDLHKVPATIISRTQHFAFHSISSTDLAAQLQSIATLEHMKVSDDALAAIAIRGDGSFRDSISLLDQLAGFADDNEGITLELVQTTLGLAPTEAVQALLLAVADRDAAGVISQLDCLEREGIQPVVLAGQLISAVRERLAAQPQYVLLLDSLLSVTNSPQPQLKLLTVLVGAIKPKLPTTVPANAQRPKIVVEAPVVELAKPKPTNKKFESTSAPEPEQPIAAPVPKQKKKSSVPITLDWDKLIDTTRKNHLALHSVLSKCGYKLDGDTLTLYTGRKFNKTKLDDPKYLTTLHQVLAEAGHDNILIVTVPTAKPPADEQLAKIAAMMGGGHEVAVESIDESR